MWQDLYIHSISAGNPFYQVWKLLSAEIWKTFECHFSANVMLRQSRLLASRASPAQKLQGLRVVCSKNFSRATFFFSLGHIVGRYILELFARETNLMKKRSVRVGTKFSYTLKCEFVADWFMWIKIALSSKFWLVSYTHFLKISFKLINWGLSYSLKRDPRPFSECTQVCTILSLTASKNAFWRLPLIDRTFNWGQFHLSIKIEFPDNQ